MSGKRRYRDQKKTQKEVLTLEGLKRDKNRQCVLWGGVREGGGLWAGAEGGRAGGHGQAG